MLRPIALIVSGGLLVALSACHHGGYSTAASATPQPSSTAPSITTQPSGQTATVGGTATFTVAAAGATPLTYQWSKGGVPIAGATSATYTTSAVAATDDGAMYSVRVSNSAGKVTSVAAKLAHADARACAMSVCAAARTSSSATTRSLQRPYCFRCAV